MPEISVSEKILSEDYADLILPVTLSGSYFLNAYMQMGGELLGGNYGVIHVPLSSLPRDLLAYVGYYNIPKLYTLLDESSLEASGILKVRSQPLLGYTGKDVILGFLDTGIDYTQPIFRRSDGRSRIVGLWDQTDQTGTPPENLSYGSAYTGEDLNRALTAEAVSYTHLAASSGDNKKHLRQRLVLFHLDILEGTHSVVYAAGQVQNGEKDHSTGAFAQAHIAVQWSRKAQSLQNQMSRRLFGNVGSQHVFFYQGADSGCCQGCHCGNKAIDHDGHAIDSSADEDACHTCYIKTAHL